MPPAIIALFICGIAAVITIAVIAHMVEQKRRQALAQVADDLDLQFSPDKDRDLAARFAFLDRLAHGHNRFAWNHLWGDYHGGRIDIFDYHYQTTSGSGKNRRTNHYYREVFALELPRRFPELTVAKEGILSKIAQFVGYEDIDFESAEFSRSFVVRSADKRFAYDVLHPRTMAYLLGNPDLCFEIEGHTLGVVFNGKLDPHSLRRDLARVAELRALLPDHILEPAA